MQDIAELIGWLIIGTPVVLGLVGAVVLNLWPALPRRKAGVLGRLQGGDEKTRMGCSTAMRAGIGREGGESSPAGLAGLYEE